MSEVYKRHVLAGATAGAGAVEGVSVPATLALVLISLSLSRPLFLSLVHVFLTTPHTGKKPRS